MTGRRRRSRRPGAGVLALLALLAVARGADAPVPAEHARLAAHGLLIGIAAAGGRLVAVGDRGVIVFSDDGGASWVQAASVPVQALLTGVCFLDARHGVAVGHDELILRSADGGVSWQVAHYAPEAQRPLLDVWCGSAGRVIAVGAYSAFLTSADGGVSWTAVKFSPAPASSSARAVAAEHPADTAGGGFHLNRIVAAGEQRLYIAGEAGHLYRSDDAGRSWITLAAPYAGSFFGALPLDRDVVLAFGLRGNLYRSEDAGASWQRIPSGTVAMLDGGARLGGSGVALVGLSGVVLLSNDGGHTFALQQQADHAGLAAAVPAGAAGALAAVGEYGVQRITLAGRQGIAGDAH